MVNASLPRAPDAAEFNPALTTRVESSDPTHTLRGLAPGTTANAPTNPRDTR